MKTYTDYPMDYEPHCLYQQLFEDVRRYFRYEADPANQRKAEVTMRETMRKILERQETP
jgi:hypothetical protein